MSSYQELSCSVSRIITWSQLLVALLWTIFVVYCGFSWHGSTIREAKRRDINNDEQLPKSLIYLTRVSIISCTTTNLCIIISTLRCLYPTLKSHGSSSFPVIVIGIVILCYVIGGISVLYVFFLRLKLSLHESSFEYDPKVYKIFQISLIILVVVGISVFLLMRINWYMAVGLVVVGLTIYIVLAILLLRLFVKALLRVCFVCTVPIVVSMRL